MADEETPRNEVPTQDLSGLLPEGIRAWASRAAASAWIDWIAAAALLAAVGVGSAYLMTPGLYGQLVPYGEGSVGEVAQYTIKADRDYDIPDQATTERQRHDAALQVLPVYDYDPSVFQGANARVRSGFLRMQEACSAARALLPLPVNPGPDVRRHPASKRDAAPSGVAPELMQAMNEAKDEFFRDLQVTLDDDDFHALEEARFSGEVEKEVEKLLRRYQDQMIATATDELAALGNRGITIRTLSGAPRAPEEVLLGPAQQPPAGEGGPRGVTDVPDQDKVRAEIDAAEPQLEPGLTPAQRRAVLHLVHRMIRPNLTYDRAETSSRQNVAQFSIKPVIVQVKKGDRVISAGERIDKRHVLIFKGMKAQSSQVDPTQVRLGIGLLSALLLAVLFGFGRGLRRFHPTRKDALLLASLLLAMLALVDASLMVSDAMRDHYPALEAEAMHYAIPFAAGAMLVRFVLGAEEALVFAGAFAVLAGIAAGNSLYLGIYALAGSLVGARWVAGAKDRGALFRAGLATGVANALLVVALELVGGKIHTWDLAQGAFAALIGGAVLAPVLVMGAAPLVEWIGGYVTDVKLLELANLNHPALKELIVQAPGTYHHSIIMGSLVEAAAAAIGANPLLARVCAYYHDIGKGKNPLYFGENQKGENRHDKLAPAMSAVIIKRHVTDGMEMAKQYKLPKAVADAIPQHHGTRLVGYFFHKASKEQEAREGAPKEGAPPIDESTFRYPGPRPQSREAALVMIADAVEASSRALAEPNDANLQALVKKIINGIFADGQLDECDLTLRDLNVLAKALYTTLRGIYHTRPEYPPGAMQAPRSLNDGEPPLRPVPEGGPDPKGGDVKKLGT